LIIIFVYDFKYYLILDSVVLPAIILAFIFNISLGINFLNLLLAAALASGFFLLQFVVSKGTWIGGGDIRLGFLMGAILGWTQVLTALFLAYIIGSIFSIGLLLGKKKQMSDKVPFGTFLTLATFITMLYGPALYNWYVSLFNY
jgi:prepilin signal peptidase PulO-like enzyme (type II secretory pathway)